MIYHYCRVSSREQCLDRQLEALNSYKQADEVFCDKQSGKNFDRKEYQTLKCKVKPGDEIIIKELDRLGRNKEEIKSELQWFKANGVLVRILDIPTTLLNLNGQEWVAEMVNNVLIEVMGAIAEQERIKIHSRQKEGIEAMKQRGDWDKYGRPKITVPNFAPYYKKVANGEITVVQAIKELGITKAKWYRLCKEVNPMKEKEIVKEAMKTCGWNQEQLALACGYKTQSAIGNRLSGNSMRVDTFVKLLSAMGYEVVVRSVSPRVNKNEWTIDGEEK